MSQVLREAIRSGEIQCTCWNRGIRPGFRYEGDKLMYDGKQETAHFNECKWVYAVSRIYQLERVRG